MARLPVRNKSQQYGDRGEQLVEGTISDHAFWLARRQDRDFGIDLEAEFAPPAGENQLISGKLLKIQVKTSGELDSNAKTVSVTIDRGLLVYASEFRLPVILVAVCLKSQSMWWVWLQEWAMLNEARLAQTIENKSVTLVIAREQTLQAGLDGPLQVIARGEGSSAIVLALRNVLTVALGWENRHIAEGVIDVLAKIEGPEREWILQKALDILIGFGPDAPYWRAQELLPIFFKVVDQFGNTFTPDQILRLVGRGESHSRTGLVALGRLYDRWPDYTQSIGLPQLFSSAGLPAVAWYAAMRERYPYFPPGDFGLGVATLKEPDLKFGEAELLLDQDARDYIFSKWPNRGDSVLLDMLRVQAADKSEVATAGFRDRPES